MWNFVTLFPSPILCNISVLLLPHFSLLSLPTSQLKRSEDLVDMKGAEPVVRQKSEEVARRQSNDLGELDKLAGELRGRKEEEEHREERASSPSPSDGQSVRPLSHKGMGTSVLHA